MPSGSETSGGIYLQLGLQTYKRSFIRQRERETQKTLDFKDDSFELSAHDLGLGAPQLHLWCRSISH